MYRETHNALNFGKYERAGREMPCAYWVGHHPLACLAAQARLGYPESHYHAMGGLLEEPLRLVPSETLGEDFLVPADAEVVVEGYMQPGVRVPEGPFGEYPVTPPRRCPEPRCASRRSPIAPTHTGIRFRRVTRTTR